MKKIENIRIFCNKLNYILNRKQKIYGVILLFLSFLGAILETVGVSAIIPFVNIMMEPELAAQNAIMSKMFLVLKIDTYTNAVLMIGFFVICTFILKNAYFIFLSWVRAKYACKIQREISEKMLGAYFNREYSYFLNTNTGELIRGVSGNGDVDGVYLILYHGMKGLTDSMIVIGLAGGSILLIDLLFRKKMGAYGKLFWNYAGESNQVLLEGFEGIKEVILHKKQQYFIGRYIEKFMMQQKAHIFQTVGGESPAYIIEGICVTGLLAAVSLRATGAIEIGNTISILSAFVVGAFRILPSLGKISTSVNGITYAMPSMNSVYNNVKEVNMLKQKNQVMISKNEREIYPFKEILIDQITFSYGTGFNKIFDHFSLKIKRGQSIAFIGQSGAGKTTLVDIILGLLKPERGSILVDGCDIATVPSAWSKMIGYVSQSIYLLDSTVKHNIAFGIPDNEIDEKRVFACLKQAQLLEFVNQLPNGIETRVGDKGVRFSGGQRQRIAIARALYSEPEILILDEATSALDHDTERNVMEAIDALQGTLTLIVIAHRLSTVKKCDEIYSIEHQGAVKVAKERLN